MRPVRPMPTNHSGFTLIELLIVVVILAIVTAAALPSFVDAIERNRIVSQNNELLGIFALARSEAIKRNGTVGVCALNAAADGCAADNWNRGWLVWVDTDRSGAFNAGDEVLRVGTMDTKDRITTTVFDIRYGARGTRTRPANANAVLALRPNDCKAGRNNVRTLTVRATGGVRSAEGVCV